MKNLFRLITTSLFMTVLAFSVEASRTLEDVADSTSVQRVSPGSASSGDTGSRNLVFNCARSFLLEGSSQLFAFDEAFTCVADTSLSIGPGGTTNRILSCRIEAGDYSCERTYSYDELNLNTSALLVEAKTQQKFEEGCVSRISYPAQHIENSDQDSEPSIVSVIHRYGCTE